MHETGDAETPEKNADESRAERDSVAAASTENATEKKPIGRLWFWLGWSLVACGLIAACASVQTVTWQLQTLWRYTEGQCRIVSAKVVRADGMYRLEVLHQVEIDGRRYRATENTEQDTPRYNTLEEAQARLERSYPVGSLQPCWYDAADPNRHSVLVTEGIRPLKRLTLLGASLAVMVLGGWLVRRATPATPPAGDA